MDVVTKDARNVVFYEILYANSLVPMRQSMKDQRKFSLCEAILENKKKMNVNINKTKLMVSET